MTEIYLAKNHLLLAAGFSSPSHFAAVNKRMFGITASDLNGDYRLHKIADI